MLLNDRLLMDGLSNSLNLTNQDSYVRLVDEKNKENNSILAGRPFSLPRLFWLPLYGLPRRLAILFWGEHSNGLSNQADVEQILHLSCSQAIVNWLNALDQSDFFIVSLMYDNKL